MVRRVGETSAKEAENLWSEEVTTSSDASSRAWMVTFTDLVSLMLTFFVMLFAMSNVKLAEWDYITDSLSRTLNPTFEKTESPATATFNIGTIFRRRAINLDYLSSVLEEGLKDIELLSDTRVVRLEDRVIIELPGDVLFESGSALLSERAGESLFLLGGVLRNIGNQLAVNGHTDATPPAESSFASNWELSTARAASVANQLKRAGYDQDIVAHGYADSHLSYLAEVPELQRGTLSRRIDIVILPSAAESR